MKFIKNNKFVAAIIVMFTTVLLPALLPIVANAQGVCRINGHEVPCDTMFNSGAARGFFGLFLGLGIAAVIISLLATIFWIWMIVHAASKNIENKVLWILILVFTHFLGAVIYYFVIKRPYDAAHPATTPQTNGNNQQPN